MKTTCIALDLDRTTLNRQGRLSEKNRLAIEAAIQQGIHVIVASGRALSSLPEDIKNMKGIQYAITSNGAAVYDLHTQKCLQQYKMTETSVEEILKYTKEMGVAYEAFIDGQAFAQKEYVQDPVKYGATVHAIPYIQSTRQPVEYIQDFLLAHKRELDSIDVVVNSEEKKADLWKTIAQKVPDVYITSSIMQLLEISYKDAGKHSGARFLLDYLGLSRENLAAFGDGDNDADMLSFAGMGIAVENASPACKAAADAITLSHDEDGVAYGFWNILKIDGKKW
ncbi:MAG: HAD family phosphatase [Clostridia bacterium]|nr:HAD family phosphatase [Clostridia bacterium]NCC42519.1 HAD family phosphatase [Clostridia bacterium]